MTLRKEAELDIGEQFDFYEEKETAWATIFFYVSKRRWIMRIHFYRQIHKDLRRVPIRRFLHRIFYLVNGNRNCYGSVSCKKRPYLLTERA